MHIHKNDNIDVINEINLLDIMIVLAKHWKRIVIIPVVVALITAAISLFVPNIYTAKSIVYPGDDDNSGMLGAMMAQMGGLVGLAGGLTGGATKADLYVTMLKSETVKDHVIDKYKLHDRYKAKLRSDVYAKMDENTDISLGKKDGVITIAVSDKDPKLAAAISNAYVEGLENLSARLNMSGAAKSRVFLENRLTKAKVDLAVAEDALKAFQTRNKAVAITEQAKATLEGVALLRGQLVAQEVQLATLRQVYTDNSQEIKSIKATIANLRNQIAKLEGGGTEGSMPSVGAMPQLGQEYVRLLRNFKIQETLVELLTKQYEMTKLTESKDVVPFQIIQEAKVPEVKSKPKRSLIVLLAAFASLVFMIFVSIVREYSALMNEKDRMRWQEFLSVLPFCTIFRR